MSSARAAALALAALLLASLPAPAAAAPATKLVVIAKLESRQQGKRSFSFRQTLFRAKVEVGSSRVHCEQRSKRRFRCKGTYELTDGRIKVDDEIRRGTRNPTLDIVRGTGAYAGAGGTMHVENLNNHTSRNTFRLIVPAVGESPG